MRLVLFLIVCMLIYYIYVFLVFFSCVFKILLCAYEYVHMEMIEGRNRKWNLRSVFRCSAGSFVLGNL